MSEENKVIDLKAPPRPKVLVAEDERDIATLIEDWLTELYDVTLALDGKTAIQKAVWHQPQVVLLDVVMPDMGGYEVVRLLQGTPQTRSIPVVVMTAKNFDDSTIKMIKAEPNVVGFLNKPFKPSELVRMLEMAMKGGKIAGLGASAPTGGPATAVPAPPALTTAAAAHTFDPAPGAYPPPAMPSPPAPVAPVSVGPTAEVPGEMPSVVKGSSLRVKPRPARSEDPGRLSWIGRLAVFLLKTIILLTVLVVAVGVAVEWACRSTEVSVGTRVFVPPIFEPGRFNSRLPYQWNNPEDATPTVWGDGRVAYQFNRWGLRGPDFSLVASEGTTRIILLGGSRVFGKGVPESLTLARLLEKKLNTLAPGKFEVINAGFWALSPQEQWEFVLGQGLGFKPQTIVWFAEEPEADDPSIEGLRWLSAHRWLARPPFSSLRAVQVYLGNKCRSFPSLAGPSRESLWREAERTAREHKIKLAYWHFRPSGVTDTLAVVAEGGATGPAEPFAASALTTQNREVAERLATLWGKEK